MPSAFPCCTNCRAWAKTSAIIRRSGLFGGSREGFELPEDTPGIQMTLRYTAEGSDLPNDMLIHPGSRSPVEIKPYRPGSSDEIGLAMVICIDLAVGAGRIYLRDKDPHIQPFLDYNYLEDDFDTAKVARRAFGSASISRKYEGWDRLVKERVEPTDSDLESDEALDAWIRRRVATSHHVSGTCKMGPDSDPMAVVDQFGNVRGLENLKVADASIMPDCIRANTNVTSMVIGERVAAFIGEGL